MPTKHTKSFEGIAIAAYLKTRIDIDHSEVRYPDPPDCIAKLIDGSEIWIEVTLIYRNGTLAKNVNSEIYGKWFDESLGTNNEHRNNLSDKIIEAVNKKDSKDNYKSFTNEYGKGILILCIDDPLSTCEDLSKVIDIVKNTNMPLVNFHSVFLYIRPVYVVNPGAKQVSFLEGFFLIMNEQDESIKMEKRLIDYQEKLIKSLQDPEEVREYLNAALMDEDPRIFLVALKNVVEAQGGELADFGLDK